MARSSGRTRVTTAGRQRLAAVVHDSGVLLSQPLAGELDDISEAARRLKLEGVVAKRLGSRYEPGERSTAWQKLRLNVSQEFVVGSYSPGSPFDAVLVGYYTEAGAPMFAARVRAGFTPASRLTGVPTAGRAVPTTSLRELADGQAWLGYWRSNSSAARTMGTAE
jgi:ATP-dependent DNA ligase